MREHSSHRPRRRPLPAVEALETRLTPAVILSGNSADFHVDITAGDTVAIGRTDNFKLRVTANGLDEEVQQAASSIVKLTVNAVNNAANPIDLSGIHLGDFTQLSQVLVKIDAGDTVNRGGGWNAAGTEVIGGQKFAVFTQGNAALKVTDLTPQPPPPLARGITARLLTRAKGKRLIQVRFGDTGELKAQFRSPFQKGQYRSVKVSVKDGNGDGIADTVVVRGTRLNGKKVTREILV